MAEMTNVTQPDVSPVFFIEFLEFLDNQPFFKTLRNKSNESLGITAGYKVLDVGVASVEQRCPLEKSPDQPVSPQESISVLP
jgi:hypothetical protein